MKRALTTSVLALLLTAGSVAMADNNDHRGDHRSDRGNRSEQRRDGDHNRDDNRNDRDRNDHGRPDRREDNKWRNDHRNDDHRNDRRYDGRRDWNRDHRYDHNHNNYYRNNYYSAPRYDSRPRFKVYEYRRPSGYYYHSWRRGEYLPSSYRAPVYVVNNYSYYHLRRPPYGYHWVRVDNDVILAAIAGGLVAEVISGLFY